MLALMSSPPKPAAPFDSDALEFHVVRAQLTGHLTTALGRTAVEQLQPQPTPDLVARQLQAVQSQVALRYIENDGAVADRYPANPNGSPQGIAGLSSADGRVSIMMPHPERVFRRAQFSWHPGDWGEDGPWLWLFRNARVWLS